MRIRIISDIHCDINSNDIYNYNFSDDFVICCGDISGDRFATENWIKKNIKSGIFIAGNHLGYNMATGTSDDTLTNSIKYLQKQFCEAPIYFLENQFVEIEDIIFIGCTLFTDFKLYNKSFESMLFASRKLNDFRYVQLLKRNKIKLITPMDQVAFFNKSIKFIESICKKYSNKKVVVITHHAPSFKSVPDSYKRDILSAAYASNLESIIEKYNNLKLWCHGHMHESCDYILHGTRIVCNPRGYYNENPYFKENGIVIDTEML